MGILSDRRFAGAVLLVLVVLIALFVVRAVRHAIAAGSGANPAVSVIAGKVPLVSPDGKLQSLPASTGYSIDVVVQKATTVAAGQAIGIPVDSTTPLTVIGWAADTPDGKLASNVFVAINGTQWFDCTYGTSRPDVAKVLSLPGLEKSGFKCVIPAGKLPAGNDSLAVAIVNAAGTGFYTGRSNVSLVVQ